MTVGWKRWTTAAALMGALGFGEASMGQTRTATPNQTTANAVARQLQSVPGIKVNINARNGVVVLAGTAANSKYRDQAVQAAKKVAGVKEVQSQISLAKMIKDPAVRRTDGEYYGGGEMMGGGGYPGGGEMMGGGMPAPAMAGGYEGGGYDAGGYGGPAPMMGGGGYPGGYDGSGPAPVCDAQLSGAGAPSGAAYPNYAWPSQAPYSNYSAVGYPTAYPWQAWPNIGPFHPYPEPPLDWRAVTLRWDDGVWWLDFKKHYTRPFFTPYPFGLFAY